MEVYSIIISIVLFILGFLMTFGQLNFLIDRYEVFHKAIKKKEFSVDREGLSNFYAILFFVLGIPLLIGAIIGFINPELYETFSVWLFVAVAVVGIIGILYCNISDRFIRSIEDTTEISFQD